MAAFAAAPAAGASAAAISGSDPGVGALIAVSAAAFSLGVQHAYNKYQEYSLAQGLKGNQASQSVSQQAANTSKPISGKCLSDYCDGLVGAFTKASNGQGGKLDVWRAQPSNDIFQVDLYWHQTDKSAIVWKSPGSPGHEYLRSFSLNSSSMEHVTVPYGDGYYKLFLRPWDIRPADHMGGGTYRLCANSCP